MKRISIASCLILACLPFIWLRVKYKPIVKPVPFDTLAVIEKILDGSELKKAWPDAGRTMFYMAKEFELNPYLIPAISRVENVNIARRNPGGLSNNEKPYTYDSFTRGTFEAAVLLNELKPIYDRAGNPDMDALAKVYCPKNWKEWKRNLIAVYERAMK